MGSAAVPHAPSPAIRPPLPWPPTGEDPKAQSPYASAAAPRRPLPEPYAPVPARTVCTAVATANPLCYPRPVAPATAPPPSSGSAEASRATPGVPEWVGPWTDGHASLHQAQHHDQGLRTSVRVVHGPRFSHVTVRAHGVHHLPDLELQHATTHAYRRVRQALEEGQARHPVRFWNFIPGIGDPAGAGLDRYMVFNAGRYAAFADWFHASDRNQLAPRIATATGVGHDGPDLVVHCLGDRLPGLGVENPRQCAAYHYSEAYGPLPPCFARATLVQADDHIPRARVIVGGTASIVGEKSVHLGDVPAQTRETLDNIDALLQAAGAEGLDALHHVRIYHVHHHDRNAIRRLVHERLPHLADRLEMVHAPLCRPDLDVEIEGLADVE